VLVVALTAWAARPAVAQQGETSNVRVALSKAKPATASYDGELPPLITRSTFFGDPTYAGAQVSPDGSMISFRKPYEGVMNIWVKGVDEPFDAARPITADTTRPVRSYTWTENSAYVLYAQDKGGNENFHVYAVDPDAEPTDSTGVPPARDLTPYDDVRARIVAAPESTPNEILVGLNDRNPQVHDLYRIDVETGERTLVRKNTMGVTGWVTDLDGNLRLATRQTEEGGTEIMRVNPDTLITVYECSFEESCSPVRFHKNGAQVYMTTNKGEDVDLTRLVLFNPLTKTTELVEKDPEGKVDFGGAAFSDLTDELEATYYVGDTLRVYPKTEAFRDDLQYLQKNLDGEVRFGSSTNDARHHIVRSTSDTDPGSVYLFDRATNEVERLYRSRPELPSEHLAPMTPIEYEARDGLTIPAYLTVPKGVEAKDLPTVVLVHGGPWSRDTWGYDARAQYLANRGYAVLQPNFRGSTGYGQDFLNAGNEEWGDKMQNDLTDGVRYLVDRGIADSSRVGIYGASYGGYATLAGLTFTPEVYDAGVSYVGPSNLLTLLNSIPPYWKPVQNRLFKRVGNPNEEEDRKRLRRQSPLFSAEEIQAPLLVIQGANDPRVKKQESDQIVVAARENGVDVQYLLAPNEGHGFRKENNRLASNAKMEMFFAKHLGGRAQTSMPDPVRERLNALTVPVDSVTVPDTLDQGTPTAEAGGGTPSGTAGTLADADGSTLVAGTMAYETDVSMRGRSMNRSVTRTLMKGEQDGEPVWRVEDRASTPQGEVVETLVMHRTTLMPIEHTIDGPMMMEVTYDSTSAEGSLRAGRQSANLDETFDQPTLAGGPHLTLALAGMPLQEGYTTSMHTYNERQKDVQSFTATVTGTETVETDAGSFETYVVKLDADGQGPDGTIHVMKDAPHYTVKTDLQIPTPRGRANIEQALTKWTPSG
jgi:dipeptidyl aminopeptidase/acylaminoacyl peptidase